MIYSLIAVGCLALLLLVLLIYYRLQITNLNKQLSFVISHQTNAHIVEEGWLWHELKILAENVNYVLSDAASSKRVAMHNEKSLKETLANLSHDIRTPITSLDGYFQLLSNCKQEADRERYTQIIQNRIESLKIMLELLFTYTKLQDEAYEITMEKVDFRKCVYDSLFSFYEEFRIKGIEPVTDFCSERVFVHANKKEIHRILQNILKNALEHSSEMISIKMGRSLHSVHFLCENSVDSNENIDISLVFNRFYSPHSMESFSSTGLGLSIARDLTHRMGGEIKVSLDNSTFSVELSFPLENE